MRQIVYDPTTGLVPAVVQHYLTKEVLMLGYMNEEAVKQTRDSGRVVFWSRSKNRLWMKGETSGNFLEFLSLEIDCDGDALLIAASPHGPTCHTGNTTCFGNKSSATGRESLNSSAADELGFLCELELLLFSRKKELPPGSYTAELFRAGRKRLAQKVGEEGVEVVISSLGEDQAELLSESADLLFHLLALLVDAKIPLKAVVEELRGRHASNVSK